MLKKVLKYDLKNIFKFLIIFYTLALVFSLFSRAFSLIENSLFAEIMCEIFKGAAISMIFSILINNIMRFWVRFTGNFYGDESYLTHTLPVSKKSLYLSKFISALISLFVSFFFILISFLIVFYSKDLFETIKNMIVPIAESFEVSAGGLLLTFALILFLEFFNILQCGFTGIILGHRRNSSKTGFSVLFGLISGLLSQSVVVMFLFCIALFNSEFMNMFITNSPPSFATLKTVAILSICAYSFIVAAGCFINIKLLKSGVNVD